MKIRFDYLWHTAKQKTKTGIASEQVSALIFANPLVIKVGKRQGGDATHVRAHFRVFHKNTFLKNVSTRSASIWALLGHHDEMVGHQGKRQRGGACACAQGCLAALSKELAWEYTFLWAREWFQVQNMAELSTGVWVEEVVFKIWFAAIHSLIILLSSLCVPFHLLGFVPILMNCDPNQAIVVFPTAGGESGVDEVLGRAQSCLQPGLCQVSTVWSG